MLLSLSTAHVMAQGVGAQGAGWTDPQLILQRPFPYQTRDADIRDVLQEMMQRVQVPAIAADGVSGRVSLLDPDSSLQDALDAIAGQSNAIWWFDGGAIHLEPADSLDSRLIPLDGISPEDLQREMQETGLAQRRFPLRPGRDTLRVIGPRGYTDAVADLASHMAARRKAAQDPQGGTLRIIRGRQVN